MDLVLYRLTESLEVIAQAQYTASWAWPLVVGIGLVLAFGLAYVKMENDHMLKMKQIKAGKEIDTSK